MGDRAWLGKSMNEAVAVWVHVRSSHEDSRKTRLRHVIGASDHRSRLRQAIFNCLSKSYLREVQRKNVSIEL